MALRDTIEAVESGVDPTVARLETKERTPFQERLYNVASFAGEIGLGVAKSGGRVLTTTFDAGRIAGQVALGKEISPVEWEKLPGGKHVTSYQRLAETEGFGSSAKAAGTDFLTLAPIKLLQIAGKYGIKYAQKLWSGMKTTKTTTKAGSKSIKSDSSIGAAPEPKYVKLPTVDSYNPTTKEEALDAAKEIQRQAEELYLDGKITKATLQTARNQVKLNESF